MSGIRTKLLSVGRIIISFFGFLYLYHILPVSRIIKTLPTVISPLLILTVAVVLLRFLLTTYALQLVTRCFHRLSYWTVFHIDVIVWVSNSFLPSSAASLAATPIIFDRYTPVSKTEGLAIKMIDYSLLGIAVGSVVFGGILYLNFTINVKDYILMACLLSAGVYFAVPAVTILSSQLDISRLPVIGNYLPEVVWPSNNQRGNLTLALTILFFAHVVLIGARFTTVAAVTGISVPISYLFLIPVIGYSVTVLPISISGAGVAETISIALLLATGVDPGLAAITIFVDRIIGVYLPVIVLYLYIITGRPINFLSKQSISESSLE